MDDLKLIVENINSKKLDLALKQCEDYSVKENIYLINNFIGVIYSLKNNQELAENYFKKSHKLNEKFEDPLKNLYLINIRKKNYSEAIRFAQKLSDLNSANDLFVYQLAYAYELNNHNLLAIENYEKCKDLNGNNKLKALNNIGNIYLKNNKPKTSLKYFLEANEIVKKDKIIINNVLLNYIKLVDTAILHISAIMNKETWGVFNIYPDWRWGALDKINPYNSLVKINQTKFNQWEDVTDQIYKKLKINFNLKEA